MSTVTIPNSDYDAFDALIHHICPCHPVFSRYIPAYSTLDENTQGDNWFLPKENSLSTGVCLRIENGFFRVFPYENQALVPFEAAVRALNPAVAVKIRNASVHVALSRM
jgi:hypothetical protein